MTCPHYNKVDIKCPHCDKVVIEEWVYCAYCGELLKERELTINDRMICINCGLIRARHRGLIERLDACDDFKGK